MSNILSSLCLVIPDETEKLKEMWHILHNELPEENFVLLKFLMEFLYEVRNKQWCNQWKRLHEVVHNF